MLKANQMSLYGH